MKIPYVSNLFVNRFVLNLGLNPTNLQNLNSDKGATVKYYANFVSRAAVLHYFSLSAAAKIPSTPSSCDLLKHLTPTVRPSALRERRSISVLMLTGFTVSSHIHTRQQIFRKWPPHWGQKLLLASLYALCFLKLTFVRHRFAGLEVHLGAAGRADLVDVVAQLVAAVLPAAEAQAFVEGLLGVAAEGHALLVGVEQRVDEEVDGALMGTLDQLVHIWDAQKVKTL